jgi:hypothetical protein
MKGKENSKIDGAYSVSDRFCRGSTGYESANPQTLLKAFLEGDLKTFDGKITNLSNRVKLFSEADLLVIPGYMRVEIEKYFQKEEDYNNIESAYKYFYQLSCRYSV